MRRQPCWLQVTASHRISLSERSRVIPVAVHGGCWGFDFGTIGKNLHALSLINPFLAELQRLPPIKITSRLFISPSAPLIFISIENQLPKNH